MRIRLPNAQLLETAELLDRLDTSEVKYKNIKKLKHILDPFKEIEFKNYKINNTYGDMYDKNFFTGYLIKGPNKKSLKKLAISFIPRNKIVRLWSFLELKLISPDIRESTLQNTALIIAITNQNLEIIKMLLDYGANPYLENKYGIDAITWATLIKNQKIVNILKRYPTGN